MIRNLSSVNPASRKLVIFDFDGTLADTKPKIVETATKVLLDFGLAKEDLGDVSRLIGPPFPFAFSQVYGLSEEDAREVTRRYRAIYTKSGPEAWPSFPGIPELLQRLHDAGKLAAVASSKRQAVLEKALSDEGVTDLFDCVCGKHMDDTTTKAQSIAEAMDHFGLGPTDSIMVGDRKYDVAGALSNGVPCIGVTWGGTGDYQELSEAGAACVVGSVGELGSLLLG